MKIKNNKLNGIELSSVGFNKVRLSFTDLNQFELNED